MRVATGLAIGAQADIGLVTQAVQQAMRRISPNQVSSVLLFLTSEFAHDPLPAIRAAAKAAGTLLVTGCSAPGIFTEQDWVLDAPAVAAMVFSAPFSLSPAQAADLTLPRLTLSAPNAINSNWLTAPGLRYGGVSGDVLGQGAFSVWQHAKGELTGHCEAVVEGANIRIGKSQGLRQLGEVCLLDSSQGYVLKKIGHKTALASLNKQLHKYPALALHSIVLLYADKEEMLSNGEYQMASIISTDAASHVITVSQAIPVGHYVSWAIRDATVAGQEFQQLLKQMAQMAEMTNAPEFGIMFSCLGRGPYFYGGMDRDLQMLQQQYPEMPLIGFYGNGEIAPMLGQNMLLQYAAVIALFEAK